MTARIGSHRTLGGRADLARVAAALADSGLGPRQINEGLVAAARALGYGRVNPDPAVLQSATSASTETPRSPDNPGVTELSEYPFWQPYAFTWHGHEARDEREASVRETRETANEDTLAVQKMQEVRPPATSPLSPRRRLVPLLQRALTANLDSRELDITALVRAWTRGKHLQRLPRLPRRCWPSLVVIVDVSRHLAPFRPDQHAILDLLAGVIGASRITIRTVEDDDFSDLDRDALLAGLPVLALTDLGWYGGPHLERAWLRLGRQLRRAGEQIHALAPVPMARWTGALTRAWSPLPWERPSGSAPSERREVRVDRLLNLAAHARRLEPGLLRALRLLLPRDQADVGTEADAWMHEDLVSMCPGATLVRPERAPARRARLASAPDELSAKVSATLKTWHWHCQRQPELWYMEALALAHAGGTVDANEKARAERFVTRLSERGRELLTDKAASTTIIRWLRYVQTHAPAVWERTTAAGVELQRIWWALRGADDPPPDADPTLIPGSRAGLPKTYSLRHVGDALEIWPQENDKHRVPPGAPVTTLWTVAPAVYPVGLGITSRRVTLTEPAHLRIDPSGTLELRTDCATLGLRALRKPKWATAIGRDHHGLWIDIDIWGVSFRMRWIPPGRFLMGSPDSEPGRWDDEGPQHEVVISRGFWLGETPVTQALWTTVMGANPSRFPDPARPAEMVSWTESQDFIARLGKLIEDDDDTLFRLPTEAEWEYACRAGTTTATYAGNFELKGEHDAPVLDRIAWYRGNSGIESDMGVDSDYSRTNQQSELTRASTRPVKQKQPNQWGLHDMLGNVLEWCLDTRRSYNTADPALVDPVSVGSSGDPRINRGGGWIVAANSVRAAFRNADSPTSHKRDLGFRLARGQGYEASEDGSSELEPERIILKDLDAMRDVLLRAGRIYLRGAPRSGFHRRQQSDKKSKIAFSSALKQVIDGIVTTEHQVIAGSKAFYIDIGIYDPAGAPLGVVEVKRDTSPLQDNASILDQGVARVEQYVSLANAMFGVFVLLLSLPMDATDPQIETKKAPGGLDVLVLHL
jgi:formylglycine-generating enzyme required for sulfatase activity